MPARKKSITEQFLSAARSGQVNRVKAFIAQDVDVNAQDSEKNLNGAYHGLVPPKGKEGKAGHTALMWACHRYGGDKMAIALLDAGADPNIVSIDGETALLAAVHGSQKPKILFTRLVEAGADINAVSGTETPLLRAIQNGNLEKAHILLDLGAAIRVPGTLDAMTTVGQRITQRPTNRADEMRNDELRQLIARMEKIDAQQQKPASARARKPKRGPVV